MTDLPVALAIAVLIRNQTEGEFADAMNMEGLAVVGLKHALQWAKIAAIALLFLAAGSIFFATYTHILHW